MEKLPDVRVTSATVSATSTGPNAYKLTISCTIKNEGSAPINFANVFTQGRYTEEVNSRMDLSSTNFRAGCGATLGLARDLLVPGASATMEFYCFNQVLIRSNNYVYVLILGVSENIKELSSTNNRLDIPIVFQ